MTREITITTVSGMQNEKDDETDGTKRNTKSGSASASNQANPANNNGISKFLRGEKGAIMLRELKHMMKFFNGAQRDLRQEGVLAHYKSVGSSN